MRFGLFIPQGWRFDLVGIEPAEHWPTMLDLARRADEGSFDSLWVYDHFHTTPVASEEATHEAWTLMAAFAAATSRIRLGQMCTCMSYRNPAYLAKVAATVDHVSAGRLEMGIGAGWYEHEWRAYGYGFPGAGDRLGRLREGVEIFRQMWTQGYATLDGKHYQVDGAICRPLPLQQGRSGIPLWVAGGGEKVTLRIVAEYGDYANVLGDLEVFRAKSEILAGHCRDVGRDFDEIVRTANFNAVLADSESEVAAKIAAHQARLTPYLGPDKAAEVAHGLTTSPLAGTPEQVVERLREFEGAGLGYAIGYFPDAAYDRGSIELFESRVIPELRA